MKRVTCFILMLSVIIAIAACSNQKMASGAQSTETTYATQETSVNYSSDLDAVDYLGDSIIILVRGNDAGYCRQTNDVGAETINGEVLNDAIYERNLKIEEKYNVDIQVDIKVDASGTLIKAVSAGDELYDFTLNGLSENFALATGGYLIDLNTVPYLDFNKPYWMSSIMEDTSIVNKNYFAVGDMTIQAYYSTGIIFFNKNLASEYNLDSPYQLVNDAKWTFDKMVEQCRNVSVDLNGDQKFTETDQYGLTYNNFAWQVIFYGIDEVFVSKDEEDIPYFNDTNERIISFIQKLMPLSLDPTVTLYSEFYKSLGGSYRTEVCQNAFMEGRALFWLEALYGVPTLRDMEYDFGILPVPKYDEKQEKYSAFIHTTHASSISIPKTNTDTDKTGRIIEDMTYYTTSTVKPSFIETTLKGKFSRDNDSEDMIDIILQKLRADLGIVLNYSGLTIDGDLRSYMDKGSSDISSLYAKKLEVYNSAIKKVTDTIQNLK